MNAETATPPQVGTDVNRSLRYDHVGRGKSDGVTYTPSVLADFVTRQIVRTGLVRSGGNPLRLLDPAVGHGELLVSLLQHLQRLSISNVEVCGFETDLRALELAHDRLRIFPGISLDLRHTDFLSFVLENFLIDNQTNLFCEPGPSQYDVIIANPPYVRNQIMGARNARILARQFGLTGRHDLYYAFIIAISHALHPNGIAGLIISNRFMTVRSGSTVRRALLERLNIHRAWDLGDTKLFDAAVLPAVLILQGKKTHGITDTPFTSIYETSRPATRQVSDPLTAVALEGLVGTEDGRSFQVRHGTLDTAGASGGVWRLATPDVDEWLATVSAHTWSRFREIGKIRVGVKTCADRVFIRSDWHQFPDSQRPELLRPLITHHTARHFKPHASARQILYPHKTVDGRRKAVDLTRYPRSRAYLETHRSTLQDRHYLKAAGRHWYEIWVPQSPEAWQKPKLVFRDITDDPTFWIDLNGSVVNGDCYWMAADDPTRNDFLWLAAAVGNSTFVARFYDYRFHNKLYAGRRRFMTQYVENFPLPDPTTTTGMEIISKSKSLYHSIPSPDEKKLRDELNSLVWNSFGLPEEVDR